MQNKTNYVVDSNCILIQNKCPIRYLNLVNYVIYDCGSLQVKNEPRSKYSNAKRCGLSTTTA